MIWLAISEILCLVLAFSFAIINTSWMRWLSLVYGAAAHCLLIGSCAQKIAMQDAALYRAEHRRISCKKAILLAVGTMLPAVVLYLLLSCLSESRLMLNVFLLLNAPFIQIHRLLIGGREPFSAISALRRILMALPPLVTAAAFYIGYQVTYIPAVAKMDASSHRS